MTKNYYSVPTMVIFRQRDGEDGEEYILGGIAYKDFIICGECGGIIPIDELKDDFGDDAFGELQWINISDAIVGD